MNHKAAIPVLIFVIFASSKYTSADLFRLPTDVTPHFYSLGIKLENWTHFSGNVSIDLELSRELFSVKLHSANLKIIKASINQDEASFHLDPSYDVLEISHKQHINISPGFNRIFIQYSGKIANQTQFGFSVANFTINSTAANLLAVTDNEPIYARSLFPCFDEPRFKARFRLSVIIPDRDNYYPLSNMKQISSVKTSEGIITKFATSPIMPTYVLCLAITNYTYAEKILHINNRSLPIRIYSHNINASEERVVKLLNETGEILNFFLEYFGTEGYQLEKLDMIEYDRRYSTATENWGLITFRQRLLRKLEESGRPFVGYLATAKTVAHEIAHFYFGNLVTNAWWDDVWLQEGLSDFMAYKYVQSKYPSEFQIADIYLEEIDRPFKDELLYSNQSAIVRPRDLPSDITIGFNRFTYYKARTLLCMLETAIGPEKVRDILRRYVTKFQYKTASTSDFLLLLDDVQDSKYNLREFFESYLYQNSYPVVSIRENKDSYILTQAPWKFGDEKLDLKWTIPITYITSLEPKKYQVTWFDSDLDNLTIAKLPNETWIKLNYGYFGYYLVDYDDSLFNKLLEHIDEIGDNEIFFLSYNFFQAFSTNIKNCDQILRYILRAIKILKEKLFAIYAYFVNYTIVQGGLLSDKEATELLEKYRGALRQLVYNHTSDEEIMMSLKKNEIKTNKTAKELRSYKPVPYSQYKFNASSLSEPMKKCAEWMKSNILKYIDQSV